MIKRSTLYKDAKSTERWAFDENKYVTYEFQFKGHTVKPGMKLKFKHDREVYTFKCLVHDSKLGKTWLELISPTGFYSKTMDRLTQVVGVKRSYKKKVK